MEDGDAREIVQKPYKRCKLWLCFDVANWHFDGVVMSLISLMSVL
jgi:hypothetical protein